MQAVFKDKTQLKINKFVMNWTFHSINGGSLEITFTVPLSINIDTIISISIFPLSLVISYPFQNYETEITGGENFINFDRTSAGIKQVYHS